MSNILVISASNYLSSSQREYRASPVYLNVYGSRVNNFFKFFGFSFCHTSVQVHDREWVFEPSGIVVGRVGRDPIQCLQGKNRLDSILIGYTQLEILGTARLITDFEMVYTHASYHPLTKNCHHFSDHFCRELTGNSIPRWLNRPSQNGIISCCKCLIPDGFNELDHDEFNAGIRPEDRGDHFGDDTTGTEQPSASGP